MHQRALERLVPVIKGLAEEKAAALDKHKLGQKHLDDADFLWERLLVSMSTMGNSRGWHGLIGNEDNHHLVTFEELSKLTPAARRQQVIDVLRRARVENPDQKARWLARNDDTNRVGDWNTGMHDTPE